MSKYASFAELESHEMEERDYRIVHLERPSPVAILAPHGGDIEVGTSELAMLIAGAEHSLFCFEGLKPDGLSRDLHITSHRFDHPGCLALAARHERIVSVHGCRGQAQIYLGGLDLELVGRLLRELLRAGYDTLAAGHRYPGRHPSNICNRGLRGRGAQLEITFDLRAPEHREPLAKAVRAALNDD